MANILLHTLVFAPDGVSTAYLMTDLARQLKKNGHTVTVLTTTPHYNLEAGALSRQPMEPVWRNTIYQSSLDGIDVFHIKMPMKGQRVSGRMLDYVRFHALSLLASLSLVGPYDIVIAPSPPLTMGVVAWLMGLRRGAPSVYNVQEIYPDFAINSGLLRNPTVIKLMRWIERFVYALSKKVVPISEWFKRIIEQRGVPASKLAVIPNFVDTELYKPYPRDNEFAREHGLVDDFVVLYGGNIGLSQDWESLLYAAEKVSDLPISFVIVGDGARREWLEKEVTGRQLNNVKLLGYQPRELMPLINASSDICTIPMKATTTTDTFPSKIYTILACAKPSIVSADPDSELAWLIQKAECGRVVPTDDPQAYTEAVLKAYEERFLLDEEGKRGRRFVEREYSKEAIGCKYDRLVRELVGE